MRTPKFWYKRGILSELLVPFSVVYFFLQRLRYWLAKPARLDRPVICVGNITAGGAGKTPVVIAIVQLLQAQGMKPACISRGYGGSAEGPLHVDTATHSAAEVGDEPLLLARHAPCWVGADRVATAQRAIAAGADILVFDDGMQNTRFAKDVSFAVIDGKFGVGNGLVIPAGPLRDRTDLALRRADAIILMGEASPALQKLLPDGLPIFYTSLQPHTDTLDPTLNYLAFAGIGLPEKFYATLQQAGLKVVDTVDYPDHHRYTAKDMAFLHEGVEALGATLITTEKDATRLPDSLPDPVAVLPVTLAWQSPDVLTEFLVASLPQPSAPTQE